MQDSGESLEEALAEEERTAILAAEEKLRSVERDLADLKDRHLRKLAEFENIRKRAEREKREHFRVALMDLARDFLPILDNLERAMAHASAEERKSHFGQGIGLIRRQLMDLWKRHGLEEVDTNGPVRSQPSRGRRHRGDQRGASQHHPRRAAEGLRPRRTGSCARPSSRCRCATGRPTGRTETRGS